LKKSKSEAIEVGGMGNYNNGRWSKDEHFRFLEALKLFGKEWRKV
jgi:hypothetical protein